MSLKEDLAKLARERMVAGKADPTQNSADGTKGETRQALADIAGVSHDTLAKVERIERGAIPEVREVRIAPEIAPTSYTGPTRENGLFGETL